jgi:transcriptional regulator with XRE-family HTH domain
MIVIRRWTGREAAALRQAKRMSIRAFAAHLGVTVATVSNWESRGELARLRTETQQILDLDLARAPDDVKQRLAALLDFHEAPNTTTTAAMFGDGPSRSSRPSRRRRSEAGRSSRSRTSSAPNSSATTPPRSDCASPTRRSRSAARST